MKEKLGSILNWGIGAFSLVMTNNLVVSGTGLFTGVLHLLTPEQSLLFDSMILSGLLIVYALVSIAFVLTNSRKAARGQEVAGELVKGFLDGKRKDSSVDEGILKADPAVLEYAEEANRRMDALAVTVEDIRKKTHAFSRGVMLAFYLAVLAVSVFLFIRRDVAVYINHVIIGAILIVDGVLSVISATSAKKESVYKFYVFSVVVSAVSIAIGVLFIVLSRETGLIAMQAVSVILILKSLAGFFVAFRNREVISSVADTIQKIKAQNKKTEE